MAAQLGVDMSASVRWAGDAAVGMAARTVCSTQRPPCRLANQAGLMVSVRPVIAARRISWLSRTIARR
jgi:hypothetical protein